MPKKKQTQPRQHGLNDIHAGSHYDAEQEEFIQAVLAWKKLNKTQFPLATDYLAVAKSLGYRRA